MNNDGTALLYTDQTAAEKAADHYRWKNIDLLHRLAEINESIDSVKLAAAIADGWAALK